VQADKAGLILAEGLIDQLPAELNISTKLFGLQLKMTQD